MEWNNETSFGDSKWFPSLESLPDEDFFVQFQDWFVGVDGGGGKNAFWLDIFHQAQADVISINRQLT